MSLSPSRTAAGQQDLEDAQQKVRRSGCAAVGAGLRPPEPRHAGARRARSQRSPSLACWRRGRLAAPRARPRAPAPPPPPAPPPTGGPAPAAAGPPLGARARLAPERVCSVRRPKGDGTRRAASAGTRTMRTLAARRSVARSTCPRAPGSPRGEDVLLNAQGLLFVGDIPVGGWGTGTVTPGVGSWE